MENQSEIEKVSSQSEEKQEQKIVEETTEDQKIVEEKTEETKIEDDPGHFEVTRVEDNAIFIKPITESKFICEEICEQEPIIEEPPSQQDFQVEDVSDSKIIETENMTLCKVKGNPKVRRCTKCNTFVSLNKNHSASECAARLAKFKANRGKRKSCSRKTKKQTNKFLSKLKSIAKKYNTASMRKKYKFPAPLRDLFDCVL